MNSSAYRGQAAASSDGESIPQAGQMRTVYGLPAELEVFQSLTG